MKLSKTLGEILYDLYGPNGHDQMATTGDTRRMAVYRELERHGLVTITRAPGDYDTAMQVKRTLTPGKTLCEVLAGYKPSDGPTFTKAVAPQSVKQCGHHFAKRNP